MRDLSTQLMVRYWDETNPFRPAQTTGVHPPLDAPRIATRVPGASEVMIA
jgi:hypothetical protein